MKCLGTRLGERMVFDVSGFGVGARVFDREVSRLWVDVRIECRFPGRHIGREREINGGVCGE